MGGAQYIQGIVHTQRGGLLSGGYKYYTLLMYHTVIARDVLHVWNGWS